jgi:hypothetical protein
MNGWPGSSTPTVTLTLEPSKGEKIVAAFGTSGKAIYSLSFNTSFGRTLGGQSATWGSAEVAPFAFEGHITGFSVRGSGVPTRITRLEFQTDTPLAAAAREGLQLPQGPLPPANLSTVQSLFYGRPGGTVEPWDDGATWDSKMPLLLLPGTPAGNLRRRLCLR